MSSAKLNTGCLSTVITTTLVCAFTVCPLFTVILTLNGGGSFLSAYIKSLGICLVLSTLYALRFTLKDMRDEIELLTDLKSGRLKKRLADDERRLSELDDEE